MGPMPNTTTALRWIRPPRQARSQDTLDRILEAAEELVADKGFDDTPVVEIAERAGSSVGAFYTRFRDKDGLLYALYERYLEQAAATADHALDPVRWEGRGIADVLSAVVPFLLEVFRERRGLIRSFVLRNYTDAEFAARQERLSQHVSEKLGALLVARRDEIRHPDPARAADFGLSVVLATLESVVLFGETTRSGGISDEELSRELLRTYLSYLGVESTPA